jgi:hypothetical protein
MNLQKSKTHENLKMKIEWPELVPTEDCKFVAAP